MFDLNIVLNDFLYEYGGSTVFALSSIIFLMYKGNHNVATIIIGILNVQRSYLKVGPTHIVASWIETSHS